MSVLKTIILDQWPRVDLPIGDHLTHVVNMTKCRLSPIMHDLLRGRKIAAIDGAIEQCVVHSAEVFVAITVGDTLLKLEQLAMAGVADIVKCGLTRLDVLVYNCREIDGQSPRESDG